MSQQATSADGVSIAFEARGEGTPALVFVHGWSCDRGYWSAQVRGFAAEHEVAALDLAGHGDSNANRAEWSLPAFGADVVAVVEQLGLADVVLVGHSLGGDVVTEAAGMLGARVRAVVWADTYRSLGVLEDDPAKLDAFLRPFETDFRRSTDVLVRRMFHEGTDPALVDRIAGDMASAPPGPAVATLRVGVSAETRILELLPHLSAPVFAINADHRPTDIESMRRHGVETEVLSGVGHFLMVEDPPQFDRALSRVMKRLGL